MRFYLTFISSILLTACSNSTPPNNSTPDTQKINTQQTQFIDLQGSHFRGKLFYKNNNAYFQSCGHANALPVETNSNLASIYNRINGASETPVYIEFSGEILFTDNQSSSSSVITYIEHIDHLAAAKSSLQCAKIVDTFDFKAKGEAPYWRINLQQGSLFFATKESNQSYTLSNQHIDNAQVKYIEAVNQQGQPLTLTIKSNGCYSTDKQAYWAATTQVSSAYGDFEGCGEIGKKNMSLPFAGNYLAKSIEQNKQATSTLTLNVDHSLQYELQDETQKIIKTGYWKSNSPHTLVVMFTETDKHKTQEEIIFQRKDDVLYSDKINRNNHLIRLDSELVFEKEQVDSEVVSNAHGKLSRDFEPESITPDLTVDTEVQQAIQKYFKIHQTDPKQTRFNSVRFDLNGDGKKEAIALLDWCSENGCEMLIFEEQAQGLVFSSRVSRVHAPILVSQNQSFSWQSLLVEKQKQWLQLDFDGLHYPLQISTATKVNQPHNTTGVVLFEQGQPDHWFRVK
ncbi:hypothetical protein [Psychromonas aquatilis]|uniref:NlpE C-terminal OB domain-containing protein n=1 Tax=Psychromonas aquatilis TaxID=2005072 RepID=A0ABU9GL45_9GAMM